MEVELNFKSIASLAYRFCGNHWDAEDIAQEILLEGHITGRLPDIRCRTIDYWRKGKLRGKSMEWYDLAYPIEPNCADASGALDLKHQGLKLHRAIDKLSPEQLKVIQLHYFAGYTVEEIAKQLSLPLGSAKSRLLRAQAKLRELMVG